MRVSAAAASMGVNQDRHVVIPEHDGVLVVLCDGAGGMGGGAHAAERTIRAIQDSASQLEAPALAKLLGEIDGMLAVDPRGGQTTCIVTWITPREVWGASVGDSEAWWIGPTSTSELTRGQIRRPLLGSGSARPTHWHRARRGGRVVIGSDGLFAYADAARWSERVRADADADVAAALVDLARLPTGGLQDDVTVIVVNQAHTL